MNIKPEQKKDLKDRLEKFLGRPAKESEIENMSTDALALAQHAIEKLAELEDRIKLLEKK